MYLLAGVLLLQRCVQSGSVDAEVPGGAEFHVLHQVDLRTTSRHKPPADMQRTFGTEWKFIIIIIIYMIMSHAAQRYL